MKGGGPGPGRPGGRPPGRGALADAMALFEEAAAAHRAGDVVRAGQYARQALGFAPTFVPARQMLGVLAAQAGDLQTAATHFGRVVELQPTDPVGHANLGELKRRLGDLAGAEVSCRRAVTLAPAFPEGHYNLGVVLRAQGRLPEAAESFERAIEADPTHARAHYNLGNAYLDMGRVRSALERFREAVRLQPGWADAHNNLGVALDAWEEDGEALRHYGEAARLNPADAGAQRNLALGLEKGGDMDGARASFGRAAALAPHDALLRLHAETLCPIIPASNAAIDEARARIDAALDRFADGSWTVDLATLHLSGGDPPASLTYQGRDNRPLKARWASLFDGKLPRLDPRPGDGPPHVGFVVTRGHEGVFLKGMRGLIERLPAHGLRVTVVCSGAVGEAIVRPAFPPTVGVLQLPQPVDGALAVLSGARFDVLHYWEVGTDVTNYVLPFCRPAPFQCTSWGWPDTSGIPALDVFLSGGALDGEGAEAHYTERLVRLDRLPTYYTRPPVPAEPHARSHWGLPEEARLYLCAQNLRKVHPDFDPILAEILRRDPGGLVLLIDDKRPGITAALRRRLDAAMPDVAARVRFLPRMDEAAYLALTARADVALDTLHYGGGGNTVYDAFAAGTPVVTLPTSHHRGRWTLAAYRQAGLDGAGVADTPEAYVDLAVGIATDPDRRRALGTAMQEASANLYDDDAAVAELAAFLHRAAGR